jgi:phosphate-selective porin OprO/OprP
MRQTWQKLLFIGSVILMALSLAVPPQQAWAVEKKDDKAVLDEVLDILKEKGQISEEKYQELKARAKKEGAGKVLAGFDGVTPYIQSVDGQHRIELHGRLNLDLRAYEAGSRNLPSSLGATGTDETTKFLVRRARIGVDGTFFKYLDIKVEGDFGGGSAVLTDGYVELRYWPEFKVRGGQFKVPFSWEELTSSRFIDFVERSVVNNLVPTRDVGAMVHGTLFSGMTEYAVGAFNGTGQNNTETNDSKDFAARLLVRPFRLANIPALEKFHIAGHVTYGKETIEAPAANAQSLQGQTDGRFVFFQRVSTSGDRTRYGVEAVYAYGPFSLYGEYVHTDEERNGLGPGGTDLDDVTGQAWYVAGTVFVTGQEKVPGKAPKVKSANPYTGDYGALELVARYAHLDFSSGSSLAGPPTTVNSADGNRVNALTVGFNWYLGTNTRLMFNFVQNWFENRSPFTGSPDPSQRNQTEAWEILTRLAMWF